MTDDVNLQKLENEFYKRLQDEIISKKQDEIRFSVMGDPNISYDQYQELIKAAHLRPIPKSQLDQRGETSFKRTTKYYDCEEKTQCQ